ncbi:trichothecene efflux pump [Apiospora arundinis]
MDDKKDHRPERMERVVEKRHIDGTVDLVSAKVIGGEVDEMPAGYFRGAQFIGTVVATCTASICAYLAWVMPANTLSLIDADLGPSPDIGWVGTAYLLGNGIGFLLVGRLSDIFGRRWMVLTCNSLSTVGCVVGATAPTVGALIAATLLNGFAAAGQLSHQVVLGELVPNRLRGPIVTLVFLSSLPFAVFGPAIARLFILNTSSASSGPGAGPSRVGGWRWSFYLGIMFSVVTVVLYAVFYHPPRYEQLHVRGRSKWQQVRALDFGGLFLFCAGMTLFLVGLSWGGTAYPWRSAHVLGTLVVGIATLLAFGLYEQFVMHNHGIMPPRIFRSIEYVSIVMIATLSSMVYFSLTVLWPTLIGRVFGEGVLAVGWQSSVVGGGVLLGQCLGGVQSICASLCAAAFITGLAGVLTDHTGVIALGVFATVAVGFNENIAFPGVTLLFDACDIGLAAGALASIRSMGGAVAQALYVSILNTRLAGHLESDVGPAAVRAGLPESSLADLFTAIKIDDFSAVPGATRKVLDVVELGVRNSYVESFKVVFLATIPFGFLLVVFACFVPNMEKYLTGNVARRLQRKDTERGFHQCQRLE